MSENFDIEFSVCAENGKEIIEFAMYVPKTEVGSGWSKIELWKPHDIKYWINWM